MGGGLYFGNALRLADCNLSNLMKIAVEGPPLKNACFEEIDDAMFLKGKIDVLNFRIKCSQLTCFLPSFFFLLVFFLLLLLCVCFLL